MSYNKRTLKLRWRGVTLLGFTLVCLASCVFEAKAQQQPRSSSEARPVARLVTSFRTPVARTIETSRPTTRRDSNAATATRRAVTATSAAASMERRVFEMLNAERRRNNLPTLVWDESLAQMARQHSDDMGTRNYFNHNSPEGEQASDRARQSGVTGWRALGENIAFNQGFDDPAAFAVERWMQSVKHRDNIMSRSFSHTGLGVVQTADGRVYFTQVFVTR